MTTTVARYFAGMLVVRAARWPEDETRIMRVDTSFSCDRVYSVTAEGLGFRVRAKKVTPPIMKTYVVPRLRASDRLFVAEEGGEVVGFAEVEVASWNRRATITHLYVSSQHRGKGIGAALVEALAERARRGGARCLWLETQNINYPAVQFYRRIGFRLCGLDDTLYDPASLPREVALFFVRDL
jgi:ribosomal protein S18 acetylase RimI-like enzyme